MKTVFITIDWFYPAYKAGGPVQSIVNMIEQLNDGRYRFLVCCSCNDADGTRLPVETDTWVPYDAHTQVWYASEEASGKMVAVKLIKKVKPDILFINGIYSIRFNLLPILFGQARRKIISARGMLHPGALGQKALKKRLYLACWNWFHWDKNACFHASDEAESAYITKRFGAGKSIFIAANFPRMYTLMRLPGKQPGALKMVTVALISPMKNHLLVLEALLHCTQQVRYDIYGPVKDPAYWARCLDLISRMPGNITVTYKGPLKPDEVGAVLAENHIFIMPSRSENYGHSLVEALLAGRPVITSFHTPWQLLQENLAGLNADPEDTRDLSESIIHFALMKASELESWSQHARRYALEKVAVEKTIAQYHQLFSV